MSILGNLWRFATGRPAPPQGYARKEAEKRLTSEVMTGYRPGGSALYAGAFDSNDTPGVGRVLADAEAMLSHPRVKSCLDFYKGGIAGAKFAIEDASSPEVGEFYLTELRRFWRRGRSAAQRSYEYGRGASEIVYEMDDGLLRLGRLNAFMPMDCRVLLRGNEYAGVRVRGSQRNQELWGPGSLPAKVLWMTHDRRYSRWYGWPHLYGAWRPWRRLGGKDGAEDIVDGGVYRFAFAPPIGRYPPDDMVPNARTWGVGMTDYRRNEDLMREMLEAITARGIVAMSSRRDEKTNEYLWGAEFPDRALDVSGLIAYTGTLEDAISLGLGVPPELLQAEESGSGYSGRQIPLEAFLAGQQINAEQMVEAWESQIGKPLLMWNFGPGAWAKIKVEDLLESRTKQQGGTPTPEQAAPGTPPQPPKPGTPAPPSGPKPPVPAKPQQRFGAEFEEAKHPRADDGKFGAGRGSPSEPPAKPKEESKAEPKVAGRSEPKVPKKSKAEVKLWPGSEKKVDGFLKKALPGHTVADVASLVGAPDDAKVTVTASANGMRLNILMTHPDIEGEARRYISIGNKNRPYVHNEFLVVKKDARKRSAGLKIFSDQVEACRDSGLTHIECHAARYNDMNQSAFDGYYVWPLYGYDSPISELEPHEQRAVKAKFPAAETVLDVMASEGGPEWWSKNGTDLHDARFDLAKGSRSDFVLSAYADKKGRALS